MSFGEKWSGWVQIISYTEQENLARILGVRHIDNSLVLVRGLRWVIGDGSKVRVIRNSWLRGDGGRWVSSPQGEIAYDFEDKLIWKDDKEHMYLVFLGYRLLMKEVWGKVAQECS
ncbi:hypothetical protein A2U01_0029273, partial [Trifolium medium]|nr:hypothetical protein [Trifolium medium]